MKRIVFYTTIVLASALLILCLRPVSVSRSNAVALVGRVSQISYDELNHDLNFRIAGDKRFFYVNRAAEKGIQINKVIETIKNRNVRLMFAEHWTPLDPIRQARHVTELSVGDSLIFSEIR